MIYKEKIILRRSVGTNSGQHIAREIPTEVNTYRYEVA